MSSQKSSNTGGVVVFILIIATVLGLTFGFAAFALVAFCLLIKGK